MYVCTHVGVCMGGACLCVYAYVCVLGKTGRGVGAGDQWVKPGNGNWEIDENSL